MSPTEYKVFQALSFVLYTVIAAGTGLLIATVGMSLSGCARPEPAFPAPDARESGCMREAAKRIVEGGSCQESYLSLLGLGATHPECAIYFARGSALMTVLVCENTSSAGAVGPADRAVTPLSSQKGADADDVHP